MRTRRSLRNQDILFKLLFGPRPTVHPQSRQRRPHRAAHTEQSVPFIREDYVPHYHQDDSGIFECELGSACRYRVREAAGFEKPKVTI